MIARSLLLVALAAPALAQDSTTDEYYPGENEIIQRLEEEAAAEQAAEQAEAERAAAEQESAFPSYVAPLETETSIESVREQGENFFDREGTLVIDPEAFDTIQDGSFPVPEVPPPTPVEE